MAPLPSWSTLPTKKKTLRQVRSTSDDTRLDVKGGSVKTGQLKHFQIGRITWPARQVGTMPVRAESDGTWIQGTVKLTDLELRVPRGTALRLTPHGKPIGYVLKRLDVKPLVRRGTRIKALWEPLDWKLTLDFWIDRDRFTVAAKPRPVARSWRVATGRKLPYAHKGTCSMKLLARPGRGFIMRLPLCFADHRKSRRQQLRIVGRRGAWLKLWYRIDSGTDSLALHGWVRRARLRRLRYCVCSDSSGLGGLGLAGGSSLRYATTRPLPLYARPDAQSSAIGVLKKGFIIRRQPRPIKPPGQSRAFFKVDPFYSPLYVPYHRAYTRRVP